MGVIVEKFVKKMANAINMIFCNVIKIILATFKTILETLSALGACHVIIIGMVVYKKSMIFKVFGVYRKIPNVSPGLIEVFKHFWGGLIFGGLYSEGILC